MDLFELARTIAALPLDDDMREEKIADLIKRHVHEEKHMVYFRIYRGFTFPGSKGLALESRPVMEMLPLKIQTHERLADEWGTVVGYQFKNHISFEPVFKTMESKALYWGRRWHKDQTYGQDKAYPSPYFWHLKATVSNLAMAGVTDDNIRAAGFLHDTCEDCKIDDKPITPQFLATMFNGAIADIVYRVTNEPGKNRKERHAATYPKIRGHEGATLVKLADRLANMKASHFDAQLWNTWKDPKDKKRHLWDMYVKEFPDFKKAVFDPALVSEPVKKLWDELDKLIADSPFKKQEDLD